MPTQEQLCALFDYREGQLYKKGDKRPYGWVNASYVRVKILGRLQYAHRVIWVMHYGPIPEGMLVDHRDRNRTNNNIQNLRLASRSLNGFNRSAYVRKPSGYCGIHWNSQIGKWRAMGYSKGRAVYLGVHDDKNVLVWLVHLHNRGLYTPGAKLS
jgi:hypothetical protein